MANPQAPKFDFLRIFLIATLVFIGFQLFMQRPPEDARTSQEIKAKMLEQNRDLMDVSIQQNQRALERKVDAEAQKGTITREEADRKKIQAAVIAAATQFEAGRLRDNWGKVDRSYQTLAAYFERWQQSPLWREPVTVTRADSSAWSVSAATLYGDIVADLSQRNKKHLVWGFVPGYDLIDALVRVTGSQPGLSYWVAALLLAVVVRGLVWPLAMKQYKWGRQMSQLAPLTKEIQEKYKNKQGQITDPQKMNAEVMALYKEYGINPMAGCGPILIQMPFFLLVYQCMLHYKFEFTKGTFLWIHPGAQPIFGLPLAPNLGERDYILITLYGISMIATTLMQPNTNPDPSSAKQYRIMGLAIAVIFSIAMYFYPGLPSAFVLYWTFTNILATVQGLLAHRQPLPELTKVQTVTGGVLPTVVLPPSSATKPVDGLQKGGFGGGKATPTTNKQKTKKGAK